MSNRAARWISGKLQALEALRTQALHFRNYRAVFRAYRDKVAPPPLELRNGFVLYHGPADNPWSLWREIFVDEAYTGDGFYTPRAGHTVLDVGANIGFFAVYLLGLERAVSVHAFEPSTANRERLAKNIAANGLDTAVVVHALAILDRAGTATLYTAKDAGSRSLFAGDDAGETVVCVSLDEAVERSKSKRVDLLKLDVEGAEIEILESGSRETWRRIHRVALEVHEAIRPGARERVVRTLKAKYRYVKVSRRSRNGGLAIVRATDLALT